MDYEKVDDVVFVYAYVMGIEEPIFRQVYDEYQDAVSFVQKIAESGIMVFDHQIKRHVYYPAHRIDRCEQFRAKRFTVKTEKDESNVMPLDIWHGHYEDQEGNRIYF